MGLAVIRWNMISGSGRDNELESAGTPVGVGTAADINSSGHTLDPEPRFDIEIAIRHVLDGAGLNVEFQPIFDLRSWAVGTRRVVGFEALARFDIGVAPDICFREAARMGLDAELELTETIIKLDRQCFLMI